MTLAFFSYLIGSEQNVSDRDLYFTTYAARDLSFSFGLDIDHMTMLTLIFIS